MVTHKSALMVCSAVVLGLTLASPGGAASNAVTQTNHLTFSGPVGLPGVTLPRGTYTFEVIPLHPDIVRVLSRDGLHVYFTGFHHAGGAPRGPASRPARDLGRDGTRRGAAHHHLVPGGRLRGAGIRYPDVTG